MSSRVRSRCWFFTLDNGDESMVAQLRNSFADLDYVFQLEKAESGMIHFQGVVRYKNPVGNWPDVEAHWERCRNWRKAIKYCSKVNTRIAGPWTNIEGMTWRKTLIDPLYNKDLYEFQLIILDIISGKVDDRKVYWFWDKVGNVGKSVLAKHICMNYKCCVLNGCSKDCFCAIKMMYESTDIDVVIFDLCRSQENRVSYTAIESIKNGMFFSGKYESSHIVMNPPHVIVFSNFEPEIDKLSQDRWDINEIVE